LTAGPKGSITTLPSNPKGNHGDRPRQERRERDGITWTFAANHGSALADIVATDGGEELLGRGAIGRGQVITLAPFDVVVIRSASRGAGRAADA
jgi:hypothetical protein